MAREAMDEGTPLAPPPPPPLPPAPEPSTEEPPNQRLRLLICSLISFTLLNSANNSQPAAFLPGIASDLGVGKTWVGAFFSFQTIGQLLGTVTAPLFVKATATRAPIVVLGGAILALNTFVMGIVCMPGARSVSTAVFIAYLCTGRFINGAVGGAGSVVALSMLLRVTGELNAATYVGLMEAANMIGNIFGPSVGGLIEQSFGPAAPFWVYAALIALVSVVLLFAGSESQHTADLEIGHLKDPESKAKGSEVNGWKLYSKPPVIATLCANGIVMIPMALVEPTLEPYASSEPTFLTPFQVGLVLAAMSIGAITAALFVGFVSKRVGQIVPTVAGYVLIVAGMSCFAYAPKNVGYFILALVCMGMGGMSAFVVSSLLLMRLCRTYGLDARAYAELIAAGVNLAGTLGLTIGSLLSGALSESFGFRRMAEFLSLGGLVSGLILLIPCHPMVMGRKLAPIQ